MVIILILIRIKVKQDSPTGVNIKVFDIFTITIDYENSNNIINKKAKQIQYKKNSVKYPNHIYKKEDINFLKNKQ